MGKWLDRLTKKAAKTASTTVKKEIQNTAVDFLPTAIGFGGLAFGIWIFRNHVSMDDDDDSCNNSMTPQLPAYRTINITTNNYYIGKDAREMLNNGNKNQ